ncbi:MAG: hypothetical protein O2816_13970, partial [Planctomycetota bacterium]|nr:hypothetical protein [Planctomycetota bacterium]
LIDRRAGVVKTLAPLANAASAPISRTSFGLPLRVVLLFVGYLVALFAFKWRTATQLEARVVASRTRAWGQVARALPEGALDGHRGQAVDLSTALGAATSVVELAAQVSALLERDPIPAWLAGEVRCAGGLLSPNDSNRISDELVRAAKHEFSEGHPQESARWALAALQVLWVSDARAEGVAVERYQRFARQLSAVVDTPVFRGEPARLLLADLDPWLEILSGTAWVEAQLVGMVPRRQRAAPALGLRPGAVRGGRGREPEPAPTDRHDPHHPGLPRLRARAWRAAPGSRVRGELPGRGVPLDPATGAPFAVGTHPDGGRRILAPRLGQDRSGQQVLYELSAGF